jgi:hypothetical protein
VAGGAELRRRDGVAQHLGIKIEQRNNDAVFDLEIAQLVQIRLPVAIGRKVVGDALGKQDVAGIATIHHALGDVDAGAGDVGAVIDVIEVMHRAAVNADPQRQTRLRFQGLVDLQRALDGRFDRIGENQGHAIAGRQADELAVRLGLAERRRLAHDLIEFVQGLGLFVDQQLGIADDVHEEHMGDFQAQLGPFFVRPDFFFVCHGNQSLAATVRPRPGLGNWRGPLFGDIGNACPFFLLTFNKC